MPSGPFVCLLAQTGIENALFTLYRLRFWHFSFSPEERSLVGGPLSIECSLRSGCGQGHEPTENVSIKL